jgi:hypothetical protein
MEPQGSLPRSQESSTPEPDQSGPRTYVLVFLVVFWFLAVPPISYMHSSFAHSCYMPCPSLVLVILNILGEEYKLWNSSLCSFIMIIIYNINIKNLSNSGTRNFSTIYTKYRHWTRSWASSIYLPSLKTCSLRDTLILYCSLFESIPSLPPNTPKCSLVREVPVSCSSRYVSSNILI